MAAYNFNTNANQETIITYHRNKVNTERAAQIPPLSPLADNQAFILYVLTNAFLSWKKAMNADDIGSINTVWDALPQATKDQIKTLAGV
jgi:hypothetical protein